MELLLEAGAIIDVQDNVSGAEYCILATIRIYKLHVDCDQLTGVNIRRSLRTLVLLIVL